MKIHVRCKPNSRNVFIEKIDDTHFAVSVREPPKNNQANIAIQESLAGYFKIAPSRVRLVSGFSSQSKVFEVV